MISFRTTATTFRYAGLVWLITSTLTGKLLGGWELAGATQFQTGTHRGVGTNTDYEGVSTTDLGSFGCGSEGQFWNVSGVPNVTGGFAAPVTNASSPTDFSTSSGGSPIFYGTAQGTFNLQNGVRDLICGPGFQDWNLSLYKKFALYSEGKQNIEFRAEAYDFINHPNWSAPNFNPTSSQFGMVTSKTSLARNLQLSPRFSF